MSLSFRAVGLLGIFFFCISSTVFAGGGEMPTGPIYFSDDGIHKTEILVNKDNKMDIKIDGKKKTGGYDRIESVKYIGGDSYAYAAKSGANYMQNGYILKNGEVLDNGLNLSVIAEYGPMGMGQMRGWYKTDMQSGKYTVKMLPDTTLLEVNNAGINSSSRYEGTLLISNIYDRNNTIYTTYIGTTKMGENMNISGYISEGKKTRYAVMSSYTYTPMGGTSQTRVLVYDLKTKKLVKLPAVAEGGNIAETRSPGNNQLLSISYPTKKDDKFQMVRFDGTITMDDFLYDELPMITQYGQAEFVSFKKDDRQYFRFDGKTYGPYDLVDTFNTSYGYPPVNYQSQKVVRWSVFVRKDGKDMIVVNGKEIPLQ